METYLWFYTTFLFGRTEHARVSIYAKGQTGFCYAGNWKFYFRQKSTPLFTEKLPALFREFDPPPAPRPA